MKATTEMANPPVSGRNQSAACRGEACFLLGAGLV